MSIFLKPYVNFHKSSGQNITIRERRMRKGERQEEEENGANLNESDPHMDV